MNKLILISLLVFFSISTLAHLDEGEDRVVDGYLVDFGYSPENSKANERIFLAFNLINSSANEVVEFDNLWLRISDDENILFSGTLHPEQGNVNFAISFPQKKDYEILARFRNNDKTIVETTFDLDIGSKQKSELIAGIILLVIILLIFSKKYFKNK